MRTICGKTLEQTRPLSITIVTDYSGAEGGQPFLTASVAGFVGNTAVNLSDLDCVVITWWIKFTKQWNTLQVVWCSGSRDSPCATFYLLDILNAWKRFGSMKKQLEISPNRETQINMVVHFTAIHLSFFQTTHRHVDTNLARAYLLQCKHFILELCFVVVLDTWRTGPWWSRVKPADWPSHSNVLV